MERFRMELESLSQNEEFARVVVAVFMSRLNPTLEEFHCGHNSLLPDCNELPIHSLFYQSTVR